MKGLKLKGFVYDDGDADVNVLKSADTINAVGKDVEIELSIDDGSLTLTSRGGTLMVSSNDIDSGALTVRLVSL